MIEVMRIKTVKDFFEEFDFEKMVTDPPTLIRQFFNEEMEFIKNELFVQIIEPGKDILEVGCGYGRLLRSLCKEAKKAVGIDFSRPLIKRAEELLANEDNVKLYLMNAEDMHFQDNTFDYVLCLASTLGNMPGIELEVLREMKRVTKNGGKIIVNVFSEVMKEAQEENYKRLGLTHIVDDGIGYHTAEGFYSRRFTREQLHELFHAADLECVISHFSSVNYFAVAQIN